MSNPLWTDQRIKDSYVEAFYDNDVQRVMFQMRDEYEAKIAELEAKLTTLQQLEEQHLAHIDRQDERIAAILSNSQR
jgi:hypothetical protein